MLIVSNFEIKTVSILKNYYYYYYYYSTLIYELHIFELRIKIDLYVDHRSEDVST